MINSKYDRSTFYKKVLIDNTVELDLSNCYFELFQTTTEVKHYQIDKYEAGRPDIIANNVYNKMAYWWILLKYNNIIDPIYELVEGVILTIPNEQDIKRYVSKVKKLTINKNFKTNKVD
jgi:hypothetical protein